MPQDQPQEWPLPPSVAASVTHQLCAAIFDVIHHEAAGGMSRRSYLKLCGLATAAEVFSRDAAHWYVSLMGEDHEMLVALEARYVARSASAEKDG